MPHLKSSQPPLLALTLLVSFSQGCSSQTFSSLSQPLAPHLLLPGLAGILLPPPPASPSLLTSSPTFSQQPSSTLLLQRHFPPWPHLFLCWHKVTPSASEPAPHSPNSYVPDFCSPSQECSSKEWLHVLPPYPPFSSLPNSAMCFCHFVYLPGQGMSINRCLCSSCSTSSAVPGNGK